jgi:hypothetical protein
VVVTTLLLSRWVDWNGYKPVNPIAQLIFLKAEFQKGGQRMGQLLKTFELEFANDFSEMPLVEAP